MVVSDLASGEERTVGKGNTFNKWVKLWARLVVFLSDPVEVSPFLARVAEEARLLSAVKGEWLVAVDQLIQLIDSLMFEGLLDNQTKISCFRYFVHIACLSCLYQFDLLWSKLNYLLRYDVRLLAHFFLLFDIPHCSYYNALIYVEFSQLYFALWRGDYYALAEEGWYFRYIKDIFPQNKEGCLFGSN